MPLIRCENCGQSCFSFARRSYVAHCSDCGRPLNGHQDTTSIESEIRERLYGRGAGRARRSHSPRDRVADMAAVLADGDD